MLDGKCIAESFTHIIQDSEGRFIEVNFLLFVLN